MRPLYVHALVESGPRRVAAAGRTLHLVRIDRVSAIVERLRHAPELTEAELRRQHALVAALAESFDPLLPVRFGCSMERAALAQVLRQRQRDILEAFDRVRGCRQMTVRVFGRPGARRRSTPAASGTAYLRARRADSVLVPRSGRAVQRAVASIVKAELIDAGSGDVRATLHHLVPISASHKYRRIVGSLPAPAGSDRVVVSGPWPPFAFGPEAWL